MRTHSFRRNCFLALELHSFKNLREKKNKQGTATTELDNQRAISTAIQRRIEVEISMSRKR